MSRLADSSVADLEQYLRSHANKTLLLMAQKQFAPALKAYEKALATSDNIGPLVVKVHQALTEGGNAKEADARLVRWLKDHPSDVAVRAYLASS